MGNVEFSAADAERYFKFYPEAAKAFNDDTQGLSPAQYAARHFYTQGPGKMINNNKPLGMPGASARPVTLNDPNAMDPRKSVLMEQFGNRFMNGQRIDMSGPGNYGKYTNEDAQWMIQQGLGKYLDAEKAISGAEISGLTGLKRNYVNPQYEGTGLDMYNRAVDYYTNPGKFGAAAITNAQYTQDPWELEWEERTGPDGAKYAVPKQWMQKGSGQAFNIDPRHLNWTEEQLKQYLPTNATFGGNRVATQYTNPMSGGRGTLRNRAMGAAGGFPGMFNNRATTTPTGVAATGFGGSAQAPMRTVQDSSNWRMNGQGMLNG